MRFDRLLFDQHFDHHRDNLIIIATIRRSLDDQMFKTINQLIR